VFEKRLTSVDARNIRQSKRTQFREVLEGCLLQKTIYKTILCFVFGLFKHFITSGTIAQMS